MARCGVSSRDRCRDRSDGPTTGAHLPDRPSRVCQTGSMTEVVSYNPATGAELGRVPLASADEYDAVVSLAQQTFERWRLLPAPQRGQIVREIGDELRKAKLELG